MRNKQESGIRPLLKAVKDTHYGETRKILDGSLFSESDKGLLALLKNSLSDPERRKALLDILGPRKGDPLPLSEIVDVLDRYNDLGKMELTQEDIALINFTIRYFENWFYEGSWPQVSNEQNENAKAYSYLSVPAGIVNVITKFKDSEGQSSEIVGFSLDRLLELQREVRHFAEDYLSEKRLRTILDQNPRPEKRSMIQTMYDYRRVMLDVFTRGEQSVLNEFVHGPHSSGSHAPDMYFLKTCLIAGEMARRERRRYTRDPKAFVFVPSAHMSSQQKRYIKFDFSEGRDGYSSMHYPIDRIAYCRFVVEYFLKRKKRK